MSKRPTIFAVDFDGTLAEPVPHEEEPVFANKTLYDYLIQKQKKGHIIILNTCRTGKKLEYAVRFSKENGLVFDYINDNCDWVKESYGNSRKIYADVYIDDKAVNKSKWNVPFKKEEK